MTRMQQTSMRAYKEAILPKLGIKQEIVYRTLNVYGSMTNAELARFLCVPVNCTTGRINELTKMGIVEQKEKRACDVTKHKAIVWGTTRRSPVFHKQEEMAL